MIRNAKLRSLLSHHNFARIVLVTLLAFHAWGATRGWESGALPGNEFRQTQTAITALFVKREHNYSLAYPTPVLGKPWSIPFEFPLYQWCVAALSNETGMRLVSAARAVSAVCFYLTLPAIWLLLARARLEPWQRLIAIGFVLSCPLYIFYARAFLIETMALMFSIWFLVSYVFAVERRSWVWLLVANVAGAGAGLVKVTTFIAYLLPALLWTLIWFWSDWRSGVERWWRTSLTRLAWISAAVALPFAATYGWLLFADATKAKSPTGKALLSGGMHDYNWGTWETRFSPDVWRQHWSIWNSDIIMFGALIAATVIMIIGGRRHWRWILAGVFFFLLVQTMFPILYAWHDYYYVANATMLMIAVGLGAVGLFATRLKHASWIVVLAMYGAQIGLYFKTHYPQQLSIHRGGSSLMAAISDFTAVDDVIVIAGEDWSSMTPYHAGRRALMLRRSTERDWQTIHEAFTQLKGEPVTLLLLRGDQRTNTDLLNIAASYFGFSRVPAAHWYDADVYVRPDRRQRVSDVVRRGNHDSVTAGEDIANLPPPEDSSGPKEYWTKEMSERDLEVFDGISPTPVRYLTTFGMGMHEQNGHKMIVAHSDTRLWFEVRPGRRTITAHYILDSAAYENLGTESPSDGITFTIEEITANGERVPLFSRYLNPAVNITDQGLQKTTVKAVVGKGSQIEIAIGPGPNGNYSRDWSGLGEIKIR